MKDKLIKNGWAEQSAEEISDIFKKEFEKLIIEIDGMEFINIDEESQFAMHQYGYNEAVEDVVELLKKYIK